MIIEAPENLTDDMLHVKLKMTLLKICSEISSNFQSIHDMQQCREYLLNKMINSSGTMIMQVERV